MEIPIIDLAPLTSTVNGSQNGHESEEQDLIDKVFKAMSEVGFIYLINHGINQELVEKTFEESKQFFLLPQKVKENYLIDMTKHFRGYTAPGQQILSKDTFMEFCERFSIESPDPDGNYQIPETPNLVDALEDLRKSCQPVVRMLLGLIAKSLQIEDTEFFINKYNGGNLNYDPKYPNRSMMRTHFYPKIPVETEIPLGSVRCSEHKDWGILTLLFQDSMGGLEVKSVDGEWIQATPIPNSILVNTGEIMEWWTGNLFPATAHRVLIPEQEIQKRSSRHSVVFFVNADNETIIAPITSPLINYKGHAIEDFEPIRFNDHYNGRFQMTYKY